MSCIFFLLCRSDMNILRAGLLNQHLTAMISICCSCLINDVQLPSDLTLEEEEEEEEETDLNNDLNNNFENKNLENNEERRPSSLSPLLSENKRFNHLTYLYNTSNTSNTSNVNISSTNNTNRYQSNNGKSGNHYNNHNHNHNQNLFYNKNKRKINKLQNSNKYFHHPGHTNIPNINHHSIKQLPHNLRYGQKRPPIDDGSKTMQLRSRSQSVGTLRLNNSVTSLTSMTSSFDFEHSEEEKEEKEYEKKENEKHKKEKIDTTTNTVVPKLLLPPTGPLNTGDHGSLVSSSTTLFTGQSSTRSGRRALLNTGRKTLRTQRSMVSVRSSGVGGLSTRRSVTLTPHRMNSSVGGGRNSPFQDARLSPSRYVLMLCLVVVFFFFYV